MGSTTHDDAEVAFNFRSCSAPSQARGSSLVEKLTLSVLDCRKFILIIILIKKNHLNKLKLFSKEQPLVIKLCNDMVAKTVCLPVCQPV